MDGDPNILLEQKLLLQRQLTRANETDRPALRKLYTIARKNWNEAENRCLRVGDPLIDDLYSQIGDLHRQTEHAIEEGQAIADVLDKVTTAVELGSKLVRFLV